MHWIRAAAVVVAVVAVLLLAAAGVGTRAELWPYRTGFTLLRYAAYAGGTAIALAVLALLITRPRGGALGVLIGALGLGTLTLGIPYVQQRTVRTVPPIHDITTDPTDPPLFVAVLPLRAEAPNSADYAGDSIAALQRVAYPEVQPVQLAEAPGAAFARALRAAESMGWTLVAADSTDGRIEATATTTWFGFKDDVVIRLRAEGTGTRLDVRSVSRVGRSDVGANAARIRAYVKALDAP
jgi:uncharacterized protein (DUF1499 family)